MAKIVIKDLPDNIELDQQALRSIVGGSRLSRAGVLTPLQQKSQTMKLSLWSSLLKTRQHQL